MEPISYLNFPYIPEKIVVRKEYFGGLVFNKDTLDVVEINENTYRLLNHIDGATSYREIASKMELLNHYEIERVWDCFRTLRYSGIITDGIHKQKSIQIKEVEVKKGRLSAPLGVSIELTNQCNLKCRYCFQGDMSSERRPLSKDEVFKIVYDCADMKVFNMFLSGGEPLLSPFFKEVALLARDLGLVVGFSSNGTIIDHDMAKWISDNKFDRGLQISLDGSRQEINDLLRGEGSYKKTINGIANLAEVGVHPSLAITVTKLNLYDIRDYINMAIEKEARHVHLMCLLPSGYAITGFEELQPTFDELFRLQEELQKILNDVKGKITLDWGNWCYDPPFPEFNISYYNEVDKAFTGCPAGKTKAVIGCYGDVYGCDVLKNPGMVAGNIRIHSFLNIWNFSSVFQLWRERKADSIKGKCEGCQWLFACVGGCPAVTTFHGLGFFDSDPDCPKSEMV